MFIITFDNLNSNSPSTLKIEKLTTVEELKRRRNIDRILKNRDKEAHKEHMQKYYQDNKEKRREYNKRYFKQYYLNNKEYFKEYYQNHRQVYSECFKEWYKTNAEVCKNRFKEWYQKNKDTLTEYRKTYYNRVETINCGCGMHYKKFNKKHHEITRRHQKWEEENNN